MENILNWLLVAVWLVILPVFIGVPLTKRKQNGSVIQSFFLGYLFMFAAGEVITLPMIAFDLPLHILVYVTGALWVAMAVLGIVLLIMRKRSISYTDNREDVSLYLIFAIIVILIQIYTLVKFIHFDADDSFYVGTATTDVYTDTIFSMNPYTGRLYTKVLSRYVLSPFPVFLAVVSKLCGNIHPSYLAHTILAPLFLLMAYLVQYLFSRIWFSKNAEARGMYMLFVTMMCSFAAYSKRNAADFQMIRIWQGKAFLASTFLPLLIYLWIDFCEKEYQKFEWWTLIMAVTSCCYLSSMGIMLSVIVSGIFLLIYLIYRRNLKGLIQGAACILPAVILGVIYIFL